MEQNKYEDDLKRINKMEQKIIIKEANGMDIKEDEDAKMLAMLELIDKSMQDEKDKPKTYTPAEFESRRLINLAKKKTANKDYCSKEHCYALLNVLQEYLNEKQDVLLSNDMDAVIFCCDVLGDFFVYVDSVFMNYAKNVEARKDFSDLADRYPGLNKEYSELNKKERIIFLRNVLSKLDDLIAEIKAALDDSDLYQISHVSQVFIGYSFVLMDLSMQYE